MKHHLAIVPAILVTVAALSAELAAARDPGLSDSPAVVWTRGQLPEIAGTREVPSKPQAGPSTQSASSAIFRDIPSISGRYSVGGKTIMPYVGAGFGGGYSSEADRSLGSVPPAQGDSGLRSQFGQGLSPNEFQMGVRIPF